MGFYDNRILPRIIDRICGFKAFSRQRAKIVPQARGVVLEVGYGSGLNLPWYESHSIERLIALDPAEGAMALARSREQALGFPIEHLALEGEHIPLEPKSVDTVLVTYTLCTIPDVEQALAGMKRVLKPDGQLLYCEHGVAPDSPLQRWQHRLDPMWGVVFGGCTLTRNAPELIDRAGFELDENHRGYVPDLPFVPGISLAGFQYWGRAHTVT